MAIHREPAVGAEAILAAVNRRAARASGNAGVTQHGYRPMLAECSFERPQLGVDLPERSELAHYESIVALAEAVEVEDQTTEIAVGELAGLAQEARAATHPPTLAEARGSCGHGGVRLRVRLRSVGRRGGRCDRCRCSLLHVIPNAIRC